MTIAFPVLEDFLDIAAAKQERPAAILATLHNIEKTYNAKQDNGTFLLTYFPLLSLVNNEVQAKHG